MYPQLRKVFANAPIKLIAVFLFAILMPSVLITALGLVEVFEADSYVRESFEEPLRTKFERIQRRLSRSWTERVEFYRSVLVNADRRLDYLDDLRTRDPAVRAVLWYDGETLVQAPRPPPTRLGGVLPPAELARVRALEFGERNDAAAMRECQALLASAVSPEVELAARLAAARISYRRGQKDEALGFLESAVDRFGDTVDPAGVVRAVPLYVRIAEIQAELQRTEDLAATIHRAQVSIERYREHMAASMLEFFRSRLQNLQSHRSELPPRSATPDDPAVLSGAALEALQLQLKSGIPVPGVDGAMIVYANIEPMGALELLGISVGDESAVYLQLVDEEFFDDGRVIGAELGVPNESLELIRSSEVPSDELESELRFAEPAPIPFQRHLIRFVPPPGALPAGFRGFGVVSLATFTWAVIVLVVTIIVGVLFTLRTVLREMQTARLKTDFVSFVTHELKTPLTAIRLYSETLLSGRGGDEEEQNVCLRMIDRESERLSKLIEQVLEYSRIQQHKKEFRFDPYNMLDVVTEAVRLFGRHNRDEPRVVEVNAAQHISKIRMDRAAMVELLLNLLSNAAKYSPSNKNIVVNLRESISEISVEVVDEGVGIRKRDQKRVFDKFFRAEDYLTRSVEGTGLGLTFARYIARVHNGDIRISSRPQGGSSFTLFLRKTTVLAG